MEPTSPLSVTCNELRATFIMTTYTQRANTAGTDDRDKAAAALVPTAK
jgi:hypothetical protein